MPDPLEHAVVQLGPFSPVAEVGRQQFRPWRGAGGDQPEQIPEGLGGSTLKPHLSIDSRGIGEQLTCETFVEFNQCRFSLRMGESQALPVTGMDPDGQAFSQLMTQPIHIREDQLALSELVGSVGRDQFRGVHQPELISGWMLTALPAGQSKTLSLQSGQFNLKQPSTLRRRDHQHC